MLIYCDNQIVIEISRNSDFHERMKHNEIDYIFKEWYLKERRILFIQPYKLQRIRDSLIDRLYWLDPQDKEDIYGIQDI